MDISLFQTTNQKSKGWTTALIITLALLLIIPIIGFWWDGTAIGNMHHNAQQMNIVVPWHWPVNSSLIKTPDGYRLASAPAGLQSLITNLRLLNDRDVITSEVFGLDLRGNGDGIISFSNDRGQTLQFGIKDNSLFFDRSSAGRNDFSKEFNRKYFSERFASRFFSGPWQMEVIEFTGDIAGRYMDFRV